MVLAELGYGQHVVSTVLARAGMFFCACAQYLYRGSVTPTATDMIMKQTALLLLLSALLAVGCQSSPASPTATPAPLHSEAIFPLGDAAELRLLSDGNLSQLELYYGGELQEMMATANTMYIQNEDGRIVLDTLSDCANAPTYIVRTADRSSTYGAEVWYLVSPYRNGDTDGPWQLDKVPGDRPTLDEVLNRLQ